MALKTSGALYALVLEPPGNEARELALYRRRIFSALGDASALAFPEAAPLAFGRGEGAKPRSLSAAALSALASLWAASLEGSATGYEGFASGSEGFATGSEGFASNGLVEADGMLYLGLGPSFAALVEAARNSLGELGLRPLAEEGKAAEGGKKGWPWRAGLGFFVCGRASLREAAALSPPALSFFDASLALYRLDAGPDPLSALAWRELARARRLSGPRKGRDSAPRP